MSIIHRLLNAKPPAYLPSLVANVLGGQLAMAGFFGLLRALKGKRSIDARYVPYLAALERDGVVCIPDFLSQEERREVQDLYEKLMPQFTVSVPYANSSNLLPHVERLSLYEASVPPHACNLLLEHPLIVAIARAYLRRGLLLDIRAYFTRVHVDTQEEIDSPQNGGTNNTHIDAPMRVLKFFYLVNDADEHNGTLHYARGAHRWTLRRMALEYLLSIRYAFGKWRPDPQGEYDWGKPWVRLSECEEKRYGLHPEAISGRAGTLIIANVGGYHRRGDFSVPGERRTIEISFRNADIPKNYLAALRS